MRLQIECMTDIFWGDSKLRWKLWWTGPDWAMLEIETKLIKELEKYDR